ncbi:MAG: hypothetical protein A3H69_03050 [Candidatus Sungbacteria bacterium RIFCSPLOWO2_02_FULL_47_9]|uniref:Aspartyl/glutamyl-tRNA(Asn/Gln) amidotransferase subunit C n=1 Tax=Candidatus Sungbacteria bacterium RIFCSPHIGHO2_01_FULL_47_32 TaxID=1802264 RepID=A0A1G2K5H5_9BACT|nr:MAG: Aspartyl/glutamyl-tRNA(Asn/Gln) amidotransferase subunit C [Parcubacteria group bacterium GW2011_GWA2_47_10]OGZ93831.1 MAG: hypothetical protein A2633_04335 [Candidatus Sungbacteria bacterium RIFCSPHIGHO2_01_FULL_47_32]OHA04702.1 MAG: hypothetical protein A3A28_00815 [Candidatus Sungbacteria bacterium RIFCSPLOWO2_01_FULL_47_32]OHA09064.1 MAG: hypothetical protein A3H69_03050 [Candidatus Sungbacteria bacterium RIFCSPLOWO2_02_FULL_47_9]
MSISKKDVEYIAHLARIELTAAEAAKFEGELSSVLDFVGKLNEVDTKDVMPLTGGTNLANIMREDLAKEDDHEKLERSARLVSSSPAHTEGYIKVKAVFD